jgi:hypothetical protein
MEQVLSDLPDDFVWVIQGGDEFLVGLKTPSVSPFEMAKEEEEGIPQ